jgi:hypothetical protein
MSERCAYCKKFTTLATRISGDRVVCSGCARKSQEIMVNFIRLVTTSPTTPAQQSRTSRPSNKQRKPQPQPEENKKMKKFNPFTLAAIISLSMLAGATVRCNIDDGDDKDDDKQAEFVDIHGHDIQDAVSEAMPGALVDFGDPDYQCLAIGSIDRAHDTDFDVMFITGCHSTR